MKRIISCMLFIAVVIGLCASSAVAKEAPQSENMHTVYFELHEDGSYCVITIEESVAVQAGSRATKSGTKAKQYYNANGVLQFTVYVYGEFTYNGTTATATYARYGYSIANTSWSFVSGSASCSGATATATCTFHNTLGTTKILSASLTCSPTGVLS